MCQWIWITKACGIIISYLLLAERLDKLRELQQRLPKKIPQLQNKNEFLHAFFV